MLRFGMSAELYYAASRYSLDELQDHKEDLNLVDDQGDSALLLVLQQPYAEAMQESKRLNVIRWLIDQNADISVKNNMHRTILHYIAEQNLVDCFDLLLKLKGEEALGALVEVESSNGETAISIAQQYNHNQILVRLQDLQSNISSANNTHFFRRIQEEDLDDSVLVGMLNLLVSGDQVTSEPEHDPKEKEATRNPFDSALFDESQLFSAMESSASGLGDPLLLGFELAGASFNLNDERPAHQNTESTDWLEQFNPTKNPKY